MQMNTKNRSFIGIEQSGRTVLCTVAYDVGVNWPPNKSV